MVTLSKCAPDGFIIANRPGEEAEDHIGRVGARVYNSGARYSFAGGTRSQSFCLQGDERIMIETAAPTSQTSKERLSSVVRTQVGLAFFAFILIGAIDAAVGVLQPSIRSFYGIDKATIGVLAVCST